MLALAISREEDQDRIKTITKNLEIKGVLNHLETKGYKVVLADRTGDPSLNSKPLPMHSHLITDHSWADYLTDRLNENRNGLPRNLTYAYVGQKKIRSD